jgi:hypothetical protein
MNDSRIKALKPHVSYKKRYNVPTFPLFLTSHFKSNTAHILSNNMHNIYVNTSQNLLNNKENEILPTIKWEPTNIATSVPKTVPQGGHGDGDGERECAVEHEKQHENIGFIILRHVNSSITNEYWKECYRCIKKFYPKNRILIIDDNSNYSFVTNDPLDNTMIIQSEFPTRGEFLPYYYYLRTKFCETAVMLHDSMFIKKYISFNVNNYKMLWDFHKQHIADGPSFKHQTLMLGALNNEKLNSFYNKKDLGLWNGCFGCMSVVKYDYLKLIDSEYRIACLIPYITCRDARCAFERIIGCLLQINSKEPSLFGYIFNYCKWGLSYDKYTKNEYSNSLPIIKVWTGR